MMALPVSAQRANWASMSNIGDELELKEGQTAFVVTVSEPIYLAITPKGQHCRGVRLQPVRHQPLFERAGTTYHQRNRLTPVGWNEPFSIAGPCRLRLGTHALVTMQIFTQPPAPESERVWRRFRASD